MEVAFEAVGSNGKYQKILSCMVVLVATLSLMMSWSFPFNTKKPSFLCKEKDSLEFYHECHERDLCKDEFFDYIKDEKETLNNISDAFNLYCDKAYISPILGTTFFLGGILGSVILSPIPDRYGRLEIYKILLVVNFFLHLNIMFGINEWHIVLTNMLMGIGSYAYSMSTLIITEYLDRSISGIIMSITNAIFPFCGILCALFYIFINNWRFLFLITSSLAFLAAFLGHKYFLESPRWLNSKNRFNETLAVFKQIAEINNNQENFQTFMTVNSGNSQAYNTHIKQ